MGYGMPWDRFAALCPLPIGPDGLWGALDASLGAATPEAMTVPREDRYEVTALGHRRLRVLGPHLLAVGFGLGTWVPTEFGEARALCAIVGDGDSDDHVLFFPSVDLAARWHRVDDDLDYAFERWRGGPGEPRGFARYADAAFHPHEGERMDGTGRSLAPAPGSWDAQDPGAAPAVPAEIRWYLPRLGILDLPGTLELRPLIAQWWR